jgi:hypothetical protein
MVSIRKLRLKFALVFQLYVGWFEIAETTLCLTWRFLQFLYRLSIWQLIGFSYGVSFPRRISWNAWQGATVYWWLLRIFLTGLLGGLLVDYNMSRRYITGFLFRWLIFYIDPFGSVSCKFWIVRNFLVNGHVRLLMQSRSLPHFERKTSMHAYTLAFFLMLRVVNICIKIINYMCILFYNFICSCVTW